DASPFSYARLTGLSRYTARLAITLAVHAPVRFFCQRHEIVPSAGLDWTPDQDLARWSRRVWRGRRVPLGPLPVDCLGVYCSVRDFGRIFPLEVSVLHDFSPLVLPQTHLASTVVQFRRFFARDLLASDLALADSPA